MTYKIRTKKRLTLESLFDMRSEPESKPMYKYSDGDDQIEVLNDTINLVLSRDIRKNVKIGANIAFNVARENPDLDVWYVNTYAGIAMMKEAFTTALTQSGMPVPTPNEAALLAAEALEESSDDKEDDEPWDQAAWEAGRERREKPWLYAKPGEVWVQGTGRNSEYWYRVFTDEEKKHMAEEERQATLRLWAEADHEEEEERAREARAASIDPYDKYLEEEGGSLEEAGDGVLPNLFIHDVPIGTWNTLALGGDIRARGRTEKHPVVILNSLEFAPISRSQKEKMVIEMIELREQLGLTFIVFSHKLNWDIEAGLPGRGPLGILASKSGVVVRLKDPFEHLIRSRNTQKQAGKGIVHEAHMRSPTVKFKTPSERDGVARLKEYEDYHVDPWLGSNKKSGDFLMLMARTPLLKQYYVNHRDYLFTRGLEPTEYLLDKGEYEPMEEKMEEELEIRN